MHQTDVSFPEHSGQTSVFTLRLGFACPGFLESEASLWRELVLTCMEQYAYEKFPFSDLPHCGLAAEFRLYDGGLVRRSKA
jgi:hypothetical protein